jgi:hypothetical protein
MSELLNEIDGKLHNIKHMVDIAAEAAGALDANGAAEGYFHIPMDAGNRLAFCCYDVVNRIEELIGLISKPA